MNVQFNFSKNNNRPAYMSATRPNSLTTTTTTTSYIHLRPQVNQKPNLYDAQQRKNSHPYRKFQTGTTTTFSGYTNISNYNNKNDLQQQRQQQNKNNNDIIIIQNKLSSNNNNKLPSLMSLDLFQQPSRRNRRTIQHAEQYKNQAPFIQHRMIQDYENDNEKRSSSTFNKFNGLILSDSMCRYVRPEKVSSNGIQVKVSFESGCDCSRMLDFLEQQQINQSSIFKTDFIVFSLCTNDVANLGTDLALQRCRYLIQRTRQLFPQLKSIGWLALSPRWKPSKYYNHLQMNENNQKFNQHLKILSKQMNFEIINANLQQQHMHQDGLHPSIQSGRILIEKSIYNWFVKQNKHYNGSNLNHYPFNSTTTTTTKNTSTKFNFNHYNIINQQQQQQPTQTRINHQPIKLINDSNKFKHNQYVKRSVHQSKQTNIYNKNQHHNYNDKINEQNIHLSSEQTTNYFPGKSLISHYPHFLRHKQEFFRKTLIPTELENKKEEIFHLSNIHYQTEYLKLEAEKWKIYVTASNNRKQSVEEIERMDTVIENNDSLLPVGRPSPTGLIGPPVLLDFTDFEDIFDEWLPDATPGQKRKLGQRRDDPPTPPSPRQPPPVVPRKQLPPRNPNMPIMAGSLRSSPVEMSTRNNFKQQSFNSLFPLENQNQTEKQQHMKTPDKVIAPVNEPSLIISPMQSSTPEPIAKSPSAIPKNDMTAHSSFDFGIIPIECKFHFKQMRQKCSFVTIKHHQEYLQKKYETLEKERERKLCTSFSEQERRKIIELVINITEKLIENKKNGDKKRLDNLLLDQMREKATLTITRIATESEHRCVQNVHEKFMRTLDLKLQLDKLEKRFVENMPPPSLNIFDKLQLHAKGLKSDNTHLNALREQWKNVLRKTKLDLTTLMRQAKIAELDEANKEYEKLMTILPNHLHEEKGVRNERKLVHALLHHHPGHPTGRLHSHFTSISFPPQANNKACLLQKAETRVLNLGPKFVPPAPEQVLRHLPKEIESMKEKVSAAWRRATKTIGREPPIVKKFCERIEKEIRETVATETVKDPTIKPAISYFRKIQNQKKIIFRQTDKSKVFHTDTRENYIKKSAAYMSKTNAYVEISASPLREMIDKTDKFLRNLVSKKQMPQYMLDRLRPSFTESELPHLYYNPKDHKIGEPLRPIVSGMKSPLGKIASFLDKNIRPLFDKHTPYSISNSLIFLKHLKEYETTSETSIYTFDITDLYTMIPQKEAVLAVCEFLGRHGYSKICNLSINTIKALFSHVLENSYFVLQLPGEEAKYYRQIRGGAMGSACTQVLADIYVRKWENLFIQQQQEQHELYFRFRDDVFLTTKLSPEKIEKIFEEINKSDPNISISWEGGKSVDYLDVTATIDIPNFKTTVFRKLAAQPYVLPFHSSHPPHIMRNIPYAAALRATRICSHAEDLRQELDRIRIMLLLNKYPPTFIDKQMKRFYDDLTGNKSSEALLSKEHEKYRERVLDEQWNKKTKRKIDFSNDILCHFSYTPALARFGTNFHQIWAEVFDRTPLDDTRVIYANRLTENLKQLLVKKRPDKRILKLPPPPQ